MGGREGEEKESGGKERREGERLRLQRRRARELEQLRRMSETACQCRPAGPGSRSIDCTTQNGPLRASVLCHYPGRFDAADWGPPARVDLSTKPQNRTTFFFNQHPLDPSPNPMLFFPPWPTSSRSLNVQPRIFFRSQSRTLCAKK